MAKGEKDKSGKDLAQKTKPKKEKTEKVKVDKPANSKKPLQMMKKQEGVTIIEKLIHKGWITKIKFYNDLNYIISSSLDGFIHIHDIENLGYKDGKTFNLH